MGKICQEKNSIVIQYYNMLIYTESKGNIQLTFQCIFCSESKREHRPGAGNGGLHKTGFDGDRGAGELY